MSKSIFNSFYLSIFIFFARKILRKISPQQVNGKRGRYVVIVTTDPVQVITGSFDDLDDARCMFDRLSKVGWGEDNVIYDTAKSAEANRGYDPEWTARESASVYSRMFEGTGMTEDNLAELRGIADSYGQSIGTTTFPGLSGRT